jgi:hypothetical protein
MWVLGNGGIHLEPHAGVVVETQVGKNTRCRPPILIGEEQRQMLIAGRNQAVNEVWYQVRRAN